MKGMFWIDGRLRWPLVVGVAYVSASILIVDFVWRTLTVSAEALFICTALAFVVGGLLLISLNVMFRRRGPSRPG
jgi:hypothetical protein